MKCRFFAILLAVSFVVAIFAPSLIIAQAESEEVYLGGIPVGIGLAEKGLIVTGLVDVITDEGAVCPARGSDVLTNDVIIAVNGIEITGIGEFAKIVQRSENEFISLSVKRGDRIHSVVLTPVTDALTGLKKVGLTMKSGINGIGTLSFVTKKGDFGALGHGIIDADTGKSFISDTGSIYSCTINGYKRSAENRAGELSGTFRNRDNPIGKITVCNAFGVYGKTDLASIESLSLIEKGSMREVKAGEAMMYSTIHGDKPKAYKIEIVKTSNQKKAAEKSMLIRVVDEELLAETGGILQGMSGSPIVQNGKLIGAVTHVLINDSTLGYAIYLDWMLENVA